MNPEIASFIDNLSQPWQADICRQFDQMVRNAIPDAQERIQYGKPHYLKNGKYACVLGTAKGWVSFTIFNAADLEAPDGLFEPGDPNRKTIKIKDGQAVDYALLSNLVRQASAAL